MTFLEFMEKYYLKNAATVKEWIDKGYIPGANFDNNLFLTKQNHHIQNHVLRSPALSM